MYRSTKTYGHEAGLSVAFRQHKAESHCRLIHGYAIAVTVIFEAETLDDRNWVIDFGGLSDLKEWLKLWFDHKLIVAKDDPHIETLMFLHELGVAQVITTEKVGCEAFAQIVYKLAGDWLTKNKQNKRVRVVSAEVREHGANSAIYIGKE